MLVRRRSTCRGCDKEGKNAGTGTRRDDDTSSDSSKPCPGCWCGVDRLAGGCDKECRNAGTGTRRDDDASSDSSKPCPGCWRVDDSPGCDKEGRNAGKGARRMMMLRAILVNPDPVAGAVSIDDSPGQVFTFSTHFSPFLPSWLPYSPSPTRVRCRTRHRFSHVGSGKIRSLTMAMRFLMKRRLACVS